MVEKVALIGRPTDDATPNPLSNGQMSQSRDTAAAPRCVCVCSFLQVCVRTCSELTRICSHTSGDTYMYRERERERERGYLWDNRDICTIYVLTGGAVLRIDAFAFAAAVHFMRSCLLPV